MQRKHPHALCEQCPLYPYKYVPTSGTADATHIVIGEAPGVDEVIKRIPFIGQSGKLMRQSLRDAGIDPHQVMFTNVVACRPPNNDLTQYTDAIACCEPRLVKQINAVQPKAQVLAVGNYAAQQVIKINGNSQAPKKIAITKHHGAFYKHDPNVAQVMRDVTITYHPAYVLRALNIKDQFDRDVLQFAKGEITHHWLQDEPEWIVPKTLNELEDLLDAQPDGSINSFDVETTGLIWYDRPAIKRTLITEAGATIEIDYPARPRAKLLCIGIGLADRRSVIIPDEWIFDPTDYIDLRAILYKFSQRVTLAAHNGKFDELFCRMERILLQTKIDTFLAHYATKETPPHGLKELGSVRYGVRDYEAELIKPYIGAHHKYELVPRNNLYQYLAWDVQITRQLAEDLSAELKSQQRITDAGTLPVGITNVDELLDHSRYEWPFQNLLMAGHAAFVEIELTGVALDLEYLLKCYAELTDDYNKVEILLIKMSGGAVINPRSVPQLKAYLYGTDPNRLGFKPYLDKHITKPSTGAAALKLVPGLMEHPFVQVLMQHRRIGKMLSSYIKPMLAFMDQHGRVHPSYKLAGPETGRLSAVDPAIQTAPRGKRDRYGAMIRACVIARVPVQELYRDDPVAILRAPTEAVQWTNGLLVEGDYSQAELREWAAASQDPFLLDVYRTGKDLHDETAIRLFGEMFTDEERSFCKNFNFAAAYGTDPTAFVSQHNLPRERGLAVAREYKQLLRVGLAWGSTYAHEAILRGYAETSFGRRRHVIYVAPELIYKLTNELKNFPIQSKASDFNLLVAIVLVRMGLRIVISMHDATYLEVTSDQAEVLGKVLKDTMREIASEHSPSVPWLSDVKAKERWFPKPQDAGQDVIERLTDELGLTFDQPVIEDDNHMDAVMSIEDFRSCWWCGNGPYRVSEPCPTCGRIV